MKKRLIRILTTSVIMLATVEVSMAQHGLNSIYSAYGLGDYYIRDNNAYYGMGQLGVALKSDKTINDLNPASYSSIQGGRFMLDVSFGGSAVQYVSDKENHSAGDFTFKRAAIGFNVIKNWGSVVGLRRYTDVNYLTIGQKSIDGAATQIPISIEGSGGLNQAYFGNSFLIKKRLSLGVTVGYMFGSVNQKQTAALPNAQYNFVNNTYYSQFTVNTGLQYTFNTKSYYWTLGAFFQPQISLNTLTDNGVTDINDNPVINDKEVEGKFKFPTAFGGGISVQKNRIKIGADYIQHNWKETGYRGSGFESTNAQSFAAGASYTLTRHTIWGDAPGLTLYAGYINELSYLIIQGHKLTSNAVTVGLTLPNVNNLNNYSVGLKFGTRGQSTFPLVKENFVQFVVNLSLSDFMRVGARKYRYD